MYKNNDVLVKPPGDIRIIEGYSGAFCACGHTLHIKTPKQKGWHAIQCPVCEFVVNLYCGEEGASLSSDEIHKFIPDIGIYGD